MFDGDLPSTRERKALLNASDWEAEAMLNPGQVGEPTIKAMADKGWIERRQTPSGIRQARITDAGRAALKTPIPAKPARKPRLKTLPPRIKELPPRILPPKPKKKGG